jgi:hypothetical protein
MSQGTNSVEWVGSLQKVTKIGKSRIPGWPKTFEWEQYTDLADEDFCDKNVKSEICDLFDDLIDAFTTYEPLAAVSLAGCAIYIALVVLLLMKF